MHALVIEDDPLIALVIEDMLLELGFATVDVAHCVTDAVAASERTRPDLITADVDLGTSCGIDAVEQICAVRTLPVIFVTSMGNEVQRRRAGATIIGKPFKAAELQQAIGRFLLNG